MPTETEEVEPRPLDADDPETELDDDFDLDAEALVDDLLDEIPVHGVATIEGRLTGDGRGFRAGAIVIPPLPAPFGYEYEYGHGSDNSKAAVVGRIDEMWKVEVEPGIFEVRYRGVIFPDKPYANEALQGIVDGSLRGVSVKIDDVTVDVDEERERFRKQLLEDRERAAKRDAGEDVDAELTDEQIEDILDSFIGDGTRQPTWITSARARNFDIVHMPAFVEGDIWLGSAFEDELTDEERAALKDCGCDESSEQFTVGPEDEDDEWGNIDLGYDFFRDVKADERKRLAKEGKAMPDGSFPIANEADLRNAIQAIGRAKDPEAAKRHIKKRAADLGKSDLIPEDWALVGEEGHEGWASHVYDLTMLTPEQLAHYDSLEPDEPAQRAYLAEVNPAAIVAAGSFAPGTKDGPGWITHPRATARIRRYWTRGKGAAKIRWGVPGDFNRCRRQLAKYVQNPDWLAGLCANMHYEVLKRWPGPGRNRGHSTEAAPLFALVASAAMPEFDHEDGYTPPPASFFADPQLSEPTQLTITPDGRVYGHLALWDACHVGMDGICWNPPIDDDYSYFYQGIIDTDDGPIRIGHLTYGTGHAPIRANIVQATAHYDDPAAVRAHVRVGNDSHGIWYSGILREGLTPAEVREFRANGALSGDWRWVNEWKLALIGATSVNTPGLPIPSQPAVVASAGRQVTLITPPVVARHHEEGDGQMSGQAMSAEQLAGIARAAAREVLAEQRRQDRLSARRELATKVRRERLDRARATVKEDA